MRPIFRKSDCFHDGEKSLNTIEAGNRNSENPASGEVPDSHFLFIQ